MIQKQIEYYQILMIYNLLEVDQLKEQEWFQCKDLPHQQKLQIWSIGCLQIKIPILLVKLYQYLVVSNEN